VYVAVIYTDESDDSDDDQAKQRKQNDEDDKEIQQMHVRKERRQGQRKKWSSQDLKILYTNFHGFSKAPNAAQIRKVVDANPTLHCRTLAQIKSRAWALICKHSTVDHSSAA